MAFKTSSLVLFWCFLLQAAQGQGLTQAYGKMWAEEAVKELHQIQKTEKFGTFFKDRPARISVLPFFRASNTEDLAAGGFDTTILGQYICRSFASFLGVAIRNEENLHLRIM